MSDYTHLLLAIDLSEHSDQVAIKARRIADACNAKLSVIHVIEPISFSYGGDIPLDFTSIQEDIQANLIVVGSHGRHGLALIFGSTANGVLHGAGCDVLAVRVKS